MSSLFESVLISTFRAGAHQTSLQMPNLFMLQRPLRKQSSPHGISLMMMPVCPWQIHLLSCTFSDKKSAHVDWKRCIKEENPTVCSWMSSHGHGWCLSEMSRAKCLIIPIYEYNLSLTHTHKYTQTETHSVLFLTCFLLVNVACARIYPLGEPELKDKNLLHISFYKTELFLLCVRLCSTCLRACVCVI